MDVHSSDGYYLVDGMYTYIYDGMILVKGCEREEEGSLLMGLTGFMSVCASRNIIK